jgi:isoleucyl-tRNA synthetase
VLKDRLYAELPQGPDRRGAQWVLARLHEALALLLAPIIPHTADELWEYLPETPGKLPSAHLATFPKADPAFDDRERDARWERLMAVRNEVLRDLERLRAAKEIGSGLEAAVSLGSDDPALLALLREDRELLTTLCIVSELEVQTAVPEGAARGVDLPALWVQARKSSNAKCERCWNLRPTVGQSPAHPTLCERCVRVVEALERGG